MKFKILQGKFKDEIAESTDIAEDGSVKLVTSGGTFWYAPDSVEQQGADFDAEQLYKTVGGDWGNNYGRIEAINGDIADIHLIGPDIVIQHPFAALNPVNHFGA